MFPIPPSFNKKTGGKIAKSSAKLQVAALLMKTEQLRVAAAK
ncbi:hypothetical protein [Brevibacillus migulae]|nr:hypothetical protein [Brevibacillus migulae]